VRPLTVDKRSPLDEQIVLLKTHINDLAAKVSDLEEQNKLLKLKEMCGPSNEPMQPTQPAQFQQQYCSPPAQPDITSTLQTTLLMAATSMLASCNQPRPAGTKITNVYQQASSHQQRPRYSHRRPQVFEYGHRPYEYEHHGYEQRGYEQRGYEHRGYANRPHTRTPTYIQVPITQDTGDQGGTQSNYNEVQDEATTTPVQNQPPITQTQENANGTESTPNTAPNGPATTSEPLYFLGVASLPKPPDITPSPSQH